MTYNVGQVVVSSSARLGLVWGRTRRDLILLPIVRGGVRKRSHVSVDGRIEWHEVEYSAPGYVAVALPRLTPEGILRSIGLASDALMADCLKAMIRELGARDEPPSDSLAEVRAHFDDVQAEYGA